MRKKNFRNHIINLFKKLKNKKDYRGTYFRISLVNNDKLIGYLRLISKDILKNDSEIKVLAKWRKKNQKWFPSQFNVTYKGTKKWAQEQLFEKEDRILFFVETARKKPLGHMGLFRFDWKKNSCQIDNVVRGEATNPGIMTTALKTLINWSFTQLHLKSLKLITFANNSRAIALYERCGFRQYKKIPLKKSVKKGEVYWIQSKKKSAAKRFNLVMILQKYQSKIYL